MHFKLLLVFVEDTKTEAVIEAARESGATGCTVINHARGEGHKAHKSFFGLALTTQRDVVLLLVEQHLSREILEHIGQVGEFDAQPGTGVAIQIDVEDAVGVLSQAERLVDIVEEQMSERVWVPVRKVMRTDVATVHGTTSVFEALRVMKKVQATCLIVEKRTELDEYGLVLFSDIAKQVIARDRSPERVNVYEIMAKPVIGVRPEMDIRYCARLFERFGISHAPVIEDQKLLGIVSYYLLVMDGLPDLDTP